MADKNSTRGVSTKDSEKYLEKELNSLVQNILGGWSLKFAATYVTGLPDRICLIPGGDIFFVELKTKGKKPSKIQLWVHNKLRELGFRVWVIDSHQKLLEVIEYERNRLA